MNFTELLSLTGFIEAIILFLYATRWYLFASAALKHGKPTTNNEANTANKNTNKTTLVSVLLPVYNEPNVINRLLKACTSFHSPPYEVVVIDDSDDNTTSQKLAAWQHRANVKIIHRNSRKGWKGGALNEALDKTDPQSSHVLILDADFIPPSNLVTQFITKFKDDKIAAIQGYQKHDLNAEENWITKGVRVSHSLYNMVELNGQSQLGLQPPLTGSVFMVKTDILRKLRFGEVTTEDTELTVRLHENGYKISYDPTLAASGECPNTLRRLLKQHMRWAEGHTRVFRDHFLTVLKSRFLSTGYKINFLFTGFSFLNCVLISALTVAGFVTMLLPSYFLPLPIVQASLLLFVISMPSGIFPSLIALSLEDARKDFKKIPYAWILNLLMTPAIAYAALKGLFTRKGQFHRTYKTGRILRKDNNELPAVPHKLTQSSLITVDEIQDPDNGLSSLNQQNEAVSLQQEQPLVSIIIPTLNEENGIVGALSEVPHERLKELGYATEIIVVDGNSKDDTIERAEKLGAKVMIQNHLGYGTAYKTGFSASNGQILVTFDGDHTYPPSLVPTLVRTLVKQDLDFITTNRLTTSEPEALSLVRRIGNLTLSMTARILFSVSLRDSQSGMWVIRKSALSRILPESDGMAFSQEIKIRAFRSCRCLEVPISYRKRIGEPKLQTILDGFKNLLHLLRLRFSLAP